MEINLLEKRGLITSNDGLKIDVNNLNMTNF